jgi:hypothetical protein
MTGIGFSGADVTISVAEIDYTVDRGDTVV